MSLEPVLKLKCIVSLIQTNESLLAFVREAEKAPYLAVDTEFLRERTYHAKLCLIQVAAPDGPAVAVDPLADGLDLEPLFDLLYRPETLKIFHSGRQDLEIFHTLKGAIPAPLFDTQIAAMVCGYGDSIGYEKLVQSLTSRQVDKSSQFTDWSRRPLTAKQLDYALCDVVYLLEIYTKLRDRLEETGRTGWISEETARLAEASLYEIDPRSVWSRIKIRSDKPKVLSILREVAAWREEEALRKNLPRGYIVKDDALAEIALNAPRTPEALGAVRGLSEKTAQGARGAELLTAIGRGLSVPADQAPVPAKRTVLSPEAQAILELLKMLLRIVSSEEQVAPRLLASASDLEALAQDDNADIPALSGWRYEIFGRQALDMKHGRLALTIQNGQVHRFQITERFPAS